MSAVVKSAVSVAFLTYERRSPPPPRSSPAEETYVCMIESENRKHRMKGKGMRKSGGRLLPSPTQRQGSEISSSARKSSGWFWLGSLTIYWQSTIQWGYIKKKNKALQVKNNPLILILTNALAVVGFGLIEGISSAENKRMGATSRRAEQVLERSNKLVKVEREEQKMTGTIGRKKKTKGLRNDCQRGQMWKNRHYRFAQNLADTLQMSCHKAQSHLSVVSTSISLLLSVMWPEVQRKVFKLQFCKIYPLSNHPK